MLCFITPPFERLAFTPQEGSDLNPLLQNYWMTIHPPTLYLGYVSASVPFAFAIAALATGKLGEVWIRTTRRWALTSWFFLSCGNLLGGRWAYEVLGWGGYWAWDPVENAAIMPWFTASAYLAFRHDPRKEEHVEGVEHGARYSHLCADDFWHVSHAQWDHFLGAFVHTVRPWPVFHGVSGVYPDRVFRDSCSIVCPN